MLKTRRHIKGFYSYLWLGNDSLPYYAGKGSRFRAYETQRRRFRPPTDKSKIVIFPMESESLAFESEKSLIELFGRADSGTGILCNTSDGGAIGRGPNSILTAEHRENISKGRSGMKFSPEHREALRKAKLGKPWTAAQRAARGK